MVRKFWQSRWFRPLLAFGLAVILLLAPASDAWARSGGRVGGGSFRAPSYSAPRSSGYRTAPSPVYGGGYGFGGGLGFPFLLPFFWGGGGGGLLTLFLILGVGSFVVRSLRSASESGAFSPTGYGSSAAPAVQVTEVKVGLLASARQLQEEIEALAQAADTDSPTGWSQLLQDVTLSLVRHQDYWVYGQASESKMPLSQAEQFFYQQSLQERSKFSVETFSKSGQPIAQLPQQSNSAAGSKLQDLGEYLVVTLLVASYGSSSTLPVVDSAAVLRRCLMQLGSISADRIVAVEVLWTPQLPGDTLTAEELLTEYPQLQRL